MRVASECPVIGPESGPVVVPERGSPGAPLARSGISRQLCL